MMYKRLSQRKGTGCGETQLLVLSIDPMPQMVHHHLLPDDNKPRLHSPTTFWAIPMKPSFSITCARVSATHSLSTMFAMLALPDMQPLVHVHLQRHVLIICTIALDNLWPGHGHGVIELQKDRLSNGTERTEPHHKSRRCRQWKGWRRS